MTKFHIDKIDSVRGVAILLVLSYHTQQALFPGFESETYNSKGILILDGIKQVILNLNPVGQGWIGVELFLVISGFLIHLIYLNNGSRLDFKLFYSKRCWRIYPPYIIILIFFIINVNGPLGITDIISHIFLVHNLSDKTFFTVNPSFWSIALECQLYLIYPIYLHLLRYWGNKKTLVFIFCVHFILNLIAFIYDINSLSYLTFVLNFWFIWCIGAFLAHNFYYGKKIFSKPLLWFLLFYVLIFVFKLFSYTQYFMLIPVTFSCIAFMETVLHSNFINQSFLFRQIFKLLAFIGVISYSIYLIHQPFLSELIDFFNPLTRSRSANIVFSVFFSWITILLISYSLYKLLETTSIRYGERLRNKT